ncbi:hypothetical protein AG1IA_05330 [Rhizoctonia solani AG-1 IA]|uniref:Uncharacterized protein n=1 Tax=Thanatephorus cucumeris (strain AG1-IA) TaxID=983506 RepID=L8WV12_THACA|nr:hypothetical protein AG1IA_05330 [Rhizoctonia solani AG-1 IA]
MMKFAAASLAFAALAVAQNDPSINSPCVTLNSWCLFMLTNLAFHIGPRLSSANPFSSLGQQPRCRSTFREIIPGGQPGAAPLHDFGVQEPNKKSLTWTVNQPAGTDVTFQIKDADGAVAYSATTPIQNSSDSSCLKGGSSAPAQLAPGTTGASSSTQAPPPATTPAGTPPAGTSTSSGNASTRPPATATSVPTPSSTNAPAANGALPIAQAGWTGLIGLLAALIVQSWSSCYERGPLELSSCPSSHSDLRHHPGKVGFGLLEIAMLPRSNRMRVKPYGITSYQTIGDDIRVLPFLYNIGMNS